MKRAIYLALVGAGALLVGCGDNSERCGAGTVSVDGQCIPDGTVQCGQGTVLDPVSGECEASADACAEGTVLVDGECVPEDDNIPFDLEEEAEPNDATDDGDGIAGEFDVPAEGGDGVVLHGCVTPYRDADDDGEDDIDLDAWVIHAQNPTLLEIEADGVHGLSAGFVMVPTTQPTLNAFDWTRFGVNLAGDTSSRQVYLPQGGDYVLWMSDSRSFFLGGAGSNEETCYYTTVRRVPIPAATPITAASPGTDQHDGDALFYSYDPTECDIVELSHASPSAAFQPSLDVIVSGDVHSIVSDFAHLGGLEDAYDVLIVVDPEVNYALAPVDQVVSVFRYNTVQLPTDGSTLTVDNIAETVVFPDEMTFACYDVGPNEVPYFELSSDEDFTFQWIDSDFFYVSPGFGGPDTFFSNFVVHPGAGRYYVLLYQDGDTGGSFEVESTYDPVLATPLPANGSLDDVVLNEYGMNWHTFDASSELWLELHASAVNFEDDILVTFFDPTFRGIPELDGIGDQYEFFADDGSTGAGRITMNDPETRFVRVVDFAAFFGPLDGTTKTYDLATQDRPVTNLGTVTEAAPIARDGETLTAGGTRYYFVRGGAADEMEIRVNPTNFDVTVRLLDFDEFVLDSTTGDADVDAVFSSLLLLDPTWVAFSVTDITPAGVPSVPTFDLDITVVTPPRYNSSFPAIAYSDICADDEAVDLLEEFDTDNYDADDAVTFDFETSFDFSLFGEQSGNFYRVSSNGFLAFWDFDNPLNGNGMIPADDDVNGLIAPYWDDVVVNTWCLLDNGTDTLTVQWDGRAYVDGARIQVQAILHASGVIEFVYGPGHQASGDSATVGVENFGGYLGHQYVNSIAPGTARRLTPQP